MKATRSRGLQFMKRETFQLRFYFLNIHEVSTGCLGFPSHTPTPCLELELVSALALSKCFSPGDSSIPWDGTPLCWRPLFH